jgi:hypothetical protein
MKRSELRQTALDIKTTMGAGARVSMKPEDVLALLDDADELAGLREELTSWLEVDCAGGYANIREDRLRALLDGEG